MKRKIAEAIRKSIEILQKTEVLPVFEMLACNDVAASGRPEIEINYPKEGKFGDYTTNVAMILAKKIGMSPMEIAENIILQLKSEFDSDSESNSVKGIFVKTEVVAPGHINFYLSQKYLQDKVSEINNVEKDFGQSEIGKGIKINNEFISANPTGPLHLGNGRGGFFGDALSNVLKKAGYDVISEFYVNDGGGQINKLGHSVLKDAEAVYSGEYIDELNQKYGKLSVEEAGQKAVVDVLESIIQKTVKEKMLINFDFWISEQKDIVSKGYPEKAIVIFQDKKLVYESEGALWFKSTEFGDDKDRVLIKSDGTKTYFAIDCGYILNKIERGFGKMVMNLGADHFGYLKRFEAAAKALGFSGEIKFIVCQLVRLMKDGKEARMSKRAGNVVSIDELISKVGHDVTRFFFLMYSPDTHMNFDLGLAEEHSQKNPVFYVQYAHARMCSILDKIQDTRDKRQETKDTDLSLLTHEKELDLIRELNRFPELVEEIALDGSVHKLTHYAIRLADKFHSFYNDCKVLDEDNLGMTRARLEVVKAAKIVLGETLNLIGVGAPEKM